MLRARRSKRVTISTSPFAEKVEHCSQLLPPPPSRPSEQFEIFYLRSWTAFVSLRAELDRLRLTKSVIGQLLCAVGESHCPNLERCEVKHLKDDVTLEPKAEVTRRLVHHGVQDFFA